VDDSGYWGVTKRDPDKDRDGVFSARQELPRAIEWVYPDCDVVWCQAGCRVRQGNFPGRHLVKVPLELQNELPLFGGHSPEHLHARDTLLSYYRHRGEKCLQSASDELLCSDIGLCVGVEHPLARACLVHHV
jgi:hypothetical protein